MTDKEIKAENVLEYLTEMEKLFGHDDGAREQIANALAYFTRHGWRIETERDVNVAIDAKYSLIDLTVDPIPSEVPNFMDLFHRFAGQLAFVMRMAKTTATKDQYDYLEAKLKDIINDETSKPFMYIPKKEELVNTSLSESVELFNKMLERVEIPSSPFSTLSDKQITHLIHTHEEQIAQLSSKIDEFDYNQHAANIAEAEHRLVEDRRRLNEYRATGTIDPNLPISSTFANDYEAQLLFNVQIAEAGLKRIMTENDAERWNKQVIVLHEEVASLNLERMKRNTQVKSATGA